MHRAARREITEIFTKRTAEGKLKWTGLPYPINAQAQEAGMSLAEYEDFVYSSCLVDKEDPIFRDGKVVKASAVKGDELLQQLLKIEGADRIGEAAIGTNYGIARFTKNMLFDEKMGGTIHIALGNSYPETGGLNKSAIHWDILKDMKKNGEIYADGTLFYKDGKLLI